MYCGMALRWLIAVFLCGLAAVHAARQSLQPSAVLTPTQTAASGRKCYDFKGAADNAMLEKYGVKKKWHHRLWRQRCYCPKGMLPSKGCGDFEQVKDVNGDLWPSFRYSAADPTCECRKCDDFEDAASDEWLQVAGVKRSQNRCFCPKEMFPSLACGDWEQVKDVDGGVWLSFPLGVADSTCRCLDDCQDFKGTARDGWLRAAGVKRSQDRCYCPKEMLPSKGCGDFEQVKDVNGALWPSFRYGAANSTCKCVDPCRRFEGTERDGWLREAGVKRSQDMCYCPKGMLPSKGCGDSEQVKDVNGDLWPSFLLEAADSTCTCWDPCHYFKDTANDKWLREAGVKRSQNRCYCPKEMLPSKGCGDFEQVKDVKGAPWLSFRLEAADSTCQCLDDCQDFEGTAFDWELRKYGVKRSQSTCYCSTYSPSLYDITPYPSRECGDIEEVEDAAGKTWRAFSLRAGGQGCRCLSGGEKAKERSTVVAAAAVRFCAAVVEETSNRFDWYTRQAQNFIKNNMEKMTDAARLKIVQKMIKSSFNQQDYVQKDLSVSPQLCQEILTGTLDHFNTSQRKDVFHEANGLSTHKGTKGWGYLDPLVTGGLPSSSDYQKLLRQVCHDECEAIVEQMLENIKEMTDDVFWHAKPSEESCADRVVRQVEAEVLGCCGRSCGWNNRSCSSWPFLNQTEKVDWLQQCCSEYNVLQNSTREKMCESVLSPKQVRLVSKFGTKAKKGDVGAAYIGQDPKLLWAKPGLHKFQKQLKKLKEEPKENEPVSSDFFEKNPDVRKKGLEKGWFREKDSEQSTTSLAQLGASTCEGTLQIMKKNHQHCPEQTWRNVKNTCFQEKKWQISDMPDEDDPDASQCQLKMIQPDVSRTQELATPEECRKMDLGTGVKRRFFIYNNSDPPEGELVLDKPILCFHENPCLDVKRENLDEVDHGHFKGFAKYIYWTEGS